MARAFFVVVVFILLMASCTQKVVCPAYQSAFIYDKDALRKKFSYFKEDSTPKVYTASRNKYLIGVPVSYKKKVRSLQTVAMTQVNPIVPDSLKEDGKKELNIDSVARNVYDSTAVIRIDTLATATTTTDSVYVISKEKEVRILKYDNMKRSYFVDTVGFNTEQDNYMWYLRDVLVLPDVRLSKKQEGADEDESTADKKSEKKKKKGLFKKKEEPIIPAVDSTQQKLKQENEEYGYDEFNGKQKDSTQVESQPIEPVVAPEPKKKAKTKKSSKKKTETPPAKKEEDDDGF